MLSNVTDHQMSMIREPSILGALETIDEIQLVFPIHLLKNYKFSESKNGEAIPNIVLTGPVGYLDFVARWYLQPSSY